MNSTSHSFLERFRTAPDEQDWQRFVNLYSPFLRGWLSRQGLQGADLDDLVQEVLAVVVRELPTFRPNAHAGAFRGWLRAILLNRCREFWRHGRAQPAAGGGSAFADMLHNLEDANASLSQVWNREHDAHVARQLLLRIVPDFDANTRAAFQRVVLDGIKPAAVAAELGLSVNAVLLAKSRILRRLRQELQGFID